MNAVDFFVQLLLTGLVLGTVYALVALGFVLIYKATSILNFAQGELLLFGAYLCFSITVDIKIGFIWSFLLTLAFSFILGILIERTVLRPMIGESIISSIMVTVALSIIMKNIVQIIWGTQTKVYPPIFSNEPVRIYGFFISEVHIFSLGLAVICVMLFGAFFKYSTMGLKMRVVAFDQQTAQSLGISIKKVFANSWAIAAVVASIGGIILGSINGINPGLSFMGLKVFPVVILGGLDSILGAIIGGVLIGCIESLGGGYLDPLVEGGGIKELAPFVVLLGFMMVRPYGILGKEKIERL